MAKYTEYLRLVKPEGNEYYNVEQFNHNAELIDKETKKLSDGLAKVQEGATREKAGIVQFGTEERKALEGMMLARIFGCVGYGGDIQDPGVKDINYIYYDRNTRKMYKCLNQNSDVSANVANFIPLDNNSLLERLENFIKVKNNKIFTIGNICIETINCTPNIAGVRTVKIESDFKNIFSIFLTGYITEGQNAEHLMRQVVHDYYSKIVATKQVRLYAAGNQSIELTIIGTI